MPGSTVVMSAVATTASGREADEERPTDAGAVGDAAEERRRHRHDRHRDRHHASPPEIALPAVVADHPERVVRGVDRGEDDRRERGVREVVERPGDDRAPVHRARLLARRTAPTRARAPTARSISSMIARRRSARWRARSRSHQEGGAARGPRERRGAAARRPPEREEAAGDDQDREEREQPAPAAAPDHPPLDDPRERKQDDARRELVGGLHVRLGPHEPRGRPREPVRHRVGGQAPERERQAAQQDREPGASRRAARPARRAPSNPTACRARRPPRPST